MRVAGLYVDGWAPLPYGRSLFGRFSDGDAVSWGTCRRSSQRLRGEDVSVTPTPTPTPTPDPTPTPTLIPTPRQITCNDQRVTPVGTAGSDIGHGMQDADVIHGLGGDGIIYGGDGNNPPAAVGATTISTARTAGMASKADGAKTLRRRKSMRKRTLSCSCRIDSSRRSE